ncbi:MAG: VWA domain-containing protein [Alphaproteobacteria bacterium]|nr:VWA domain-containing protein [Alphaproteobacteria bacterium]
MRSNKTTTERYCSGNRGGIASRLGRNLIDDRRGSIAIIFGMTLTIVVSLVGASVDYARWHSARSQTLRAMDAAVLAGGRQLLLNKTAEEAKQVARTYYDQNKAKFLSVDSVTFTVNSAGTEMTAVSASKVNTPMLSVAGVPDLPINETARAKLETGANAGQSVEIAMMLDTTGSMAGRRMVALKQAAIDLVNIVVWQDQSQFTSRVAIVPFAPYVNVGRDAFEDVTNKSPKGNSDNRTCVKERSNGNRYTDKAPNSSNGYFNPYTNKSACNPQAVLLPLTNDKQKLQNRINEMQPSGMTAGHLGTQWAWYALSPNFKDIWPSASEPQSYSLLNEMNDHNQPKLQKVAVLMTDGEYNEWYSGSSSTTQARQFCENMKEKGIIVYTIGFELSNWGDAKQTLRQCATGEDFFYDASDDETLRNAFRDIALKIATLRLTQ